MTERRESTPARPVDPHDPDRAAGEAVETAGRPAGLGLRRLVSAPMVRRISPRKLFLGMAFGSLMLVVLGWLGAALTRRATAWLHDQPQYRLRFDRITLDPLPPAWIRSGAAGLLAQVRQRSEWRDDDSLRVLDLDPARLADAFQLGSPWVRSVVGIERAYPNRLMVRLEYREPVATLALGPATAPRRVVLDGDGVVLPPHDLDPVEAEPLMELRLASLEGVSSPLVERPGYALAVEGAGRAVARDACRLAAFLKQRNAVAGPGTNRSPLLVKYLHHDEAGLWVETVEGAMILWRVAPGDEAPGEMTAEQKWAALQHWLQRHRLDAVPFPNFLTFDRDRVEVLRGQERS